MTQAYRIWLLGLVAVLLLGAGCAQQVGDIDRTQPNKLKKSLFQGEWYMKSTVIEVPPSAGFTVAGTQSGFGERIVWEMQENFLIARRAVEYRRNSEDGRGTNYDQDEDGNITSRTETAPVAVYSIRHFDVQRQYNPSTGEQTNVIIENGFDRPWNEREYIRVDWSRNLATDYFFLDDPNSYQFSSLRYFVDETQKDNVDRPLILDDYIEIVGKWSAKPDQEYFGGSYGWIPSCWLSFSTDCQEQVVKVLASFSKRTADRKMYKPRIWDDVKNAKFQILRTWRAGHTDQLGSPYSSTEYYANVFNMWNDENLPVADREVRPIIYYLSPNYKLTDADGNDLDPELMWGTRKTFEDWNVLLRDIAKAMGYPAEKADAADFVILCENNPVLESDREECKTRVFHEEDENGNFVKRTQDIFDITRDGFIMQGDIRFNQLNMIRQPQNYGRVLAFAQRLADIETGEAVSATTHVLWTTQEWANSRVVDYIQLMNGDLPLEKYITGNYVRERVNNEINGNPEISDAIDGDLNDQGTLAEVRDLTINKEIKPKLDLDMVSNLNVNLVTGGDVSLQDAIRGFERKARKIRNVQDNGGVGIFEARRSKIAEADQGQMEAMFRAELMREAQNFPERMQPDERTLDVLRPFSSSPTQRLEFLEQYRSFLSERHMLDAEPILHNLTWPMIAPLAERFKGQPREALLKYMRAVGYYYTLSHEIGHNMGLSHSFGSSTDALNFNEVYWLEKAAAGFVPEYLLDKESRAELYDKNQELRANQYGSIMDYMSYTEMRDEYTDDTKRQRNGLGRADYSAIAFAYGNLVEVFDESQVPTSYVWDRNRDGDATPDQTINVRTDQIQFDPDLNLKAREYHYSYFPNFVFGEQRIKIEVSDSDLSFEALKVKPFEPVGGLETDEDGFVSLVTADRNLETGEVTITQLPEDQRGPFEEVLQTAAIALSKGRRYVPADTINPETRKTADNLTEVPYRTCTNGLENRLEWCAMHDFGVDLWERTQAHVDYQNFIYYTSYFNRDANTMYVPWYYTYRSTMFEFNYIFNLHKHWINRALIQQRPFDNIVQAEDPDAFPWYLHPHGGYDGFLASMVSLEHWQRFMSRPNMPDPGYRIQKVRNADGTYTVVNNGDGTDATTQASSDILESARFFYNPADNVFEPMNRYNEDELDRSRYIDMELGDARYLRSEFDPDLGYNFYYRPVRYGSWVTKWIAIEQASDPTARIVGADTGVDAAFALNLATLFEREVFQVLAGFVSQDFATYTQGVMMDDSMAEGKAAVQPLNDAFTQLLSRFPAPAADAHIRPEESFTARLFGLFYTAALFDLASDNPFADAMNVQIIGEDREIPEDFTEGEDYLMVNDIRGEQTYVIFRHNREDGLFIRRPLAAPTWTMAQNMLDLQAELGFHDADSYREALRDAERDGDDALVTRLENARTLMDNNSRTFDRLRTLWYQYGMRYPSL